MNRLCLIGNPNITHIRRWVHDFSDLGWDVHLIGEHPLSTQPPHGCTFYDLPKINNLRKLRYIVWIYWVRKILSQIKPDILHALGVASAGWLAAASKFHPFICTALGSDLMLLEHKSLLHQSFTRWTGLEANKLICVSKPLYDIAGKMRVPETRREIISLGVNTDIFKPASNRNQIKQRLGLPDQYIVSFIRAIQPVYQPMKLVQVIPEVLEIRPNTIFVFFTYNADSVLLDTIKNYLHENRIMEHVWFIPSIETEDLLANYYQASDIAVSIPSSDGMPVSVMEAMACGTALIASDLPNLSELIIHETNGLLIPPCIDNTLKEELVRLLSNPHLLNKLCDQSAKSISMQDSRSNVIKAINEIYESSINP